MKALLSTEVRQEDVTYLSFCNRLNSVPQIVVEVLAQNAAVYEDRHLQSRSR